jgi:glycine cleavage system H protein
MAFFIDRSCTVGLVLLLIITLLTPIWSAHEYCKMDGNIATIGVTDFAAAALGDIVFVDLPEVGDDFDKGDSFGSVESVKAASDVYAPVGGTVVEINDVLSDEPGTINTAAETEGWFIKVEMSDASDADELMDEAAYAKHCEESS